MATQHGTYILIKSKHKSQFSMYANSIELFERSQIPVLSGRGRVETFHRHVDIDNGVANVVCRSTNRLERIR